MENRTPGFKRRVYGILSGMAHAHTLKIVGK